MNLLLLSVLIRLVDIVRFKYLQLNQTILLHGIISTQQENYKTNGFDESNQNRVDLRSKQTQDRKRKRKKKKTRELGI